MAEYIEKEKIIKYLDTNRYNPSEDPEDSYIAGWKTGFNAGTDRAIHDVICSKPADVHPVVRGRWIPVTNGRGGHECSKCHEYAPSYQSGNEYLSRFCPGCGSYNGADMGAVMLNEHP